MIGAAIGSVVGGLAQASAAKKAAGAQQRAAESNVELSREIYQDQTERFAPFLESGRNALNALNYEMGLGEAPEGYRGWEKTPGYDFQLSEGIGAIDNSAASKGQLFSGNTLKALNTFGQNVASTYHGNHLNRLTGLASSGQNAAGMQAAAGNNFVGNATAATNAGANAQAAGAIGVGNALSGTINNGIGLWGYMNALNGS